MDILGTIIIVCVWMFGLFLQRWLLINATVLLLFIVLDCPLFFTCLLTSTIITSKSGNCYRIVWKKKLLEQNDQRLVTKWSASCCKMISILLHTNDDTTTRVTKVITISTMAFTTCAAIVTLYHHWLVRHTNTCHAYIATHSHHTVSCLNTCISDS